MALAEPEGPGSGGREAAIHAQMGLMSDAESAVLDMIYNLAARNIEDFDFDGWRKRWETAKSTNPDEQQA
jgi:hypothetical protein